MNMKNQKPKTFALWALIFLLGALIFKQLHSDKGGHEQLKYSEFVKAVERGDVETVTLINGKNEIHGRYVPEYERGRKFRLVGDTGEMTFNLLRQNGITPDYEVVEDQGLAMTFLISWGPMILLFVIFYFFLRQIQLGGGKAMSFGKSKARMLGPQEKKATFRDVSGVEEAKEELEEVVDFLKDPKKYTALGGKIPKGVILVGPPGTGKTLLARAVAGEAGVPFFSISGSDFVEMFVGVGASRVRDLFDQGKKNAPCIIFIDEIDAVGRHRGAGLGGGHDEREQTLNQLLVEMDGFESNEGVILVAATNRIDVLDPALLRPGRFDRRVVVGRPDIRGRLGILKVHTRKTPVGKDVDLEILARGTPGFTGADLANLVNEAALLAAREDKKVVEIIDFENAKDKVLMGVARKSMVISDGEKRNTAYHEAGHTIVGINLPHTDPIHKVTIIPRGGALGVTQTLPEEDRLSLSKDRAENMVAFLFGGRIAEQMTFESYTNGAANDIERATDLARNMVCHWGMSDVLGPINFGDSRTQPFVGMGQTEGNKHYSEATAERIDAEVHAIVDRNFKMAKDILEKNKDALVRLAETLILWETLDGAQVKDIVEGKDIGSPIPPPSSPSGGEESSGGGDPEGLDEDKKDEDETKDKDSSLNLDDGVVA
ncbi:MAG: ATP-dependent zinc metalloprotease FtsH [Bacteriovoracales bacterium]|nr:ATP-dependent zinc metalloprotease FtsH [Bacteriovoracales bacterium]